MADAAESPEPVRESIAPAEYRPSSPRVGGTAVLVGVVGLLAHHAFNALLPPGPSGSGDMQRFIARATHPIWVPYQVTELLGVLLITLGLFYLYHALVGRGEIMLTIAWMFAAVLAAGTRVIEFTLGVLALPSLGSSFGAGLSQAQLSVLIEGYRAFGAGLLVVIAVLTGIAIALFGVAVYRAQLYHPVIGSGGIVLGSYMALAAIFSPGVINLSPLGVPFTILLLIWFIALGVSMIRTTPAQE